MKQTLVLVYFSATLLLLSLVSCSGPRIRVSNATNAQTSEFRNIQKKLDKEPDKGLKSLESFVEKYPETTLSAGAFLLLGDEYYKRKDFSKAGDSYLRAVPLSTEKEPEARINAARSYLQLLRVADAGSVLDPVLQMTDLPEEKTVAALKVHYMILLQKGERLQTLTTLIDLSKRATTPLERGGFRLRAQELVESRLTSDELVTAATDSKYDFVRGPAFFKLGTAAFEQSDFANARSLLRSAKDLLEDKNLQERASDMLEQIGARERVDSNVVGVVLPLSGRLQTIAYKTLRGIQLGLGVYGDKRSGIELAIVDSEGSPEIARNAIKRLVVEDHAIAIIGGLMSKTAVSEATKAQEFGVPVVCLSQRAGLTDIGSWVFRSGLTSEMQVNALVEHAMTVRKLSRFAVVYPNDPYGTEYANLFWDAVLARGGQVRGVQVYDPKETDFKDAVQKLVGTYYPEDRANEYRYLMGEWEKSPDGRSGKEPPKDLLEPIVDFDAIFIPDSAKALGQIAPMLAYNNVSNIPLIGTNLWNTPDLVSRGQKFVEGSLFVDSYVSREKRDLSAFFKRFQATFGYEPDLVEIQAYDSALMLKTALSAGRSSRWSVREALQNLGEVIGAAGTFKVSPRREVLRSLSVLTVENGQIKPLSNQ